MNEMQGAPKAKPLVSVVIIFLNAKRFIREAIDSVLHQSYDHWELILVDDGSTDESTRIAQSYAGLMPSNIRFLEHPGHSHRGMSASRNFGIRSGSGELIATLDSDDVWPPRKLEEQVEIMFAHPEVDMVYGRTIAWQTWSGNTKKIRRDILYPYRLQPDRVYQPPDLLANMLRGITQAPSMSNVLFRRHAFDQTRGFVDSFAGAFEDGVFMAKLLIGQKVFFSGSVWDRYRIHPESSSSIMIRQGVWFPERLKYLTWVGEFVSQSRLDGGQVRDALRVALRAHRRSVLLRFARPLHRFRSWMSLLYRPGETLTVEAGNVRIRNPFARGGSDWPPENT